ncbi:hypothetical protein FQN60_013133, partial [Etheostoma spectabile]
SQATRRISTVQYEHGREEDEYQPLEGAAKTTSLTSHHSDPYLLRGNAEQNEQYSSNSISRELAKIREENIRLHESQLAFHRDLEKLHSLKDDMKIMMETVCHLKEAKSVAVSYTPIRSVPGEWPNHIPPPVNIMPSAVEEHEEKWPEPPPPPWPESNERPQRDVVDHLDRVINEIQDIRLNVTFGAATQSRPATRSALLPHGDPPPQLGLTYKEPGYMQPQHYPPQSSSTPIQNYSGPQTHMPRTTWATPQLAVPGASPAQMLRGREPSYGQANRELPQAELAYRGPRPTLPDFSQRDPKLFKYQILTDHLKLEEACLVADSYLNSPTPFLDTMAALTERFGQPYQVALKRIASVMDSPDIRRGDAVAFERFALQVQSLVGMLKTLGPEGEGELKCGSHVARLLSKLPPEMRSDFRRCMFRSTGVTYTLQDFTDWLQYESRCQDFDSHSPTKGQKVGQRSDGRHGRRTTSVLHSAKDAHGKGAVPSATLERRDTKAKAYCPYCDNDAHYLNQCSAIQTLTKAQITEWIRSKNKCWRCGRSHQAAQCTLKKLCGLCQGKHLQVLHDVNTRASKEEPTERSCLINTATGVLYLDRPTDCNRVLLKVIRVILYNGKHTLDTYAILDDGSERTMLLPAAAEKLGLKGESEDLTLRTIRQDVQTLHGASVSFRVSPVSQPKKRFRINRAFTAAHLGLADQSYPVASLQKRYKNLAVFVGTRVAEIQELTDLRAWRYVDSARNPADDITRGKTLRDLAEPNRWSQGPPFLLHASDTWPMKPTTSAEEEVSELRKSIFCGVVSTALDPPGPDADKCNTWRELINVTAQELHGAADQHKFDESQDIIRVGGRLRRSEDLEHSTLHPIILDPSHPAVKLLIKDYDSRLRHPGPERVFAEIRRTFWILRGQEAIRHHQHTCKARTTFPINMASTLLFHKMQQ